MCIKQCGELFFLTVKNHEISEIECVCFLSVSEMLIFNFDFSNSPSSLKCREDKDISWCKSRSMHEIC